MSAPPNRNTANTNATTSLTAINSAFDQVFIDDANIAILQAISLGQFKVSLTTNKNCDTKTLHNYFVGLGYVVSYPDVNDLPGSTPMQPAELFGMSWDQFWANNPPSLPSPVRIILSWQ